ncbi:Immunoglobulin-like domain [Trinorchestia longiramus]|nr:Immunoglobulin-like domain [Trinorchestia longiramus]
MQRPLPAVHRNAVLWKLCAVSVTDGGNVSSVETTLRAQRRDDGSDVTCISHNEELRTEPLTTSVVVRVAYSPSVKVVLSASSEHQHRYQTHQSEHQTHQNEFQTHQPGYQTHQNEFQTHQLLEGDNVRITCSVDAQPPPTYITWTKEDIPLISHMSGIRLEGQTLTLIDVGPEHSGRYVCVATNDVGTGISSPVVISVLYTPRCVEGYHNVTQTAVPGEASTLSCRVSSFPASPLRIQWSLLHEDGTETRLRDREIHEFSDDENMVPKASEQRLNQRSVELGSMSPILRQFSHENFSFIYKPALLESKRHRRNGNKDNRKAFEKQKKSPTNSPSSYSPESSTPMSPNIDNNHTRIKSDILSIVLNFTSDSITVLCRAQNKVGLQREPCRTELRQAEVPPLSLLTALDAESSKTPQKSSLNCSTSSLSGTRDAELTCLMDEEAKRFFRSFVLLGWRNHSLLVNTTSKDLHWELTSRDLANHEPGNLQWSVIGQNFSARIEFVVQFVGRNDGGGRPMQIKPDSARKENNVRVLLAPTLGKSWHLSTVLLAPTLGKSWHPSTVLLAHTLGKSWHPSTVLLAPTLGKSWHPCTVLLAPTLGKSWHPSTVLLAPTLGVLLTSVWWRWAVVVCGCVSVLLLLCFGAAAAVAARRRQTRRLCRDTHSCVTLTHESGAASELDSGGSTAKLIGDDVLHVLAPAKGILKSTSTSAHPTPEMNEADELPVAAQSGGTLNKTCLLPTIHTGSVQLTSEWSPAHLLGQKSKGTRVELHETSIDHSQKLGCDKAFLTKVSHLHSLPKHFNQKTVTFSTSQQLVTNNQMFDDFCKDINDAPLLCSKHHSVSYDHLPTVTGTVREATLASLDTSTSPIKLQRRNSVPRKLMELQCQFCSLAGDTESVGSRCLLRNKCVDFSLPVPTPLLTEGNSCCHSSSTPNYSSVFMGSHNATENRTFSCDACRPPRKPPRPPDDATPSVPNAWTNLPAGDIAGQQKVGSAKNSENFPMHLPGPNVSFNESEIPETSTVKNNFSESNEDKMTTLAFVNMGLETTLIRTTKNSSSKVLNTKTPQDIGGPKVIPSPSSKISIGSKEDLNIIPPPLQFNIADQ